MEIAVFEDFLLRRVSGERYLGRKQLFIMP
jgi:hypothetical protein